MAAIRMSAVPHDRLVVAISSRAIFDLAESHEFYQQHGVEAYARYQIEHEDVPLQPGSAFHLVSKLLKLNQHADRPLVDVVLLSRNSADTGLRIFNSLEHYGLPVIRAAFSNGASPYPYARAFGCHLFLSADENDVRLALENGLAAAMLLSNSSRETEDNTLRFAFDGDAVLFSDEAERIYQQHGLAKFAASERALAKQPLAGGPFKPFLLALQQLQQHFQGGDCPIRTALITARSAPAHERVIRTLRAWQIRIDECLFLGGLSKGEFLRAYGADIFFDDHVGHCRSAVEHVATGHVLHGIVNENGSSASTTSDSE